MDNSSSKSIYLVARIRQEADAKEALGKKEMARRSRFVADGIERYFGLNYSLKLTELDRCWLDQYISKLQEENKTENTISRYVSVIQNTCKLASKEGIAVDMSVFEDIYTGVPKPKKSILTVSQVKNIINTDIKDKIFAHTRDIFSLCFFAGGLSIDDLFDASKSDNKISSTTEAISVRMQYADDELLSFLGDEDVRKAEYLHNLSGLATVLNIDKVLNDDTAAEAWAEVAKELGIAHHVISAVVGREIANLNYSNNADVSEDEIRDALVTVAKFIGVNTQHWFAINCRAFDKEDVVNKILELPNIKTQYIKHFSPVISRNPLKKATETENNIMKSLLFLHCLDKDAETIRRSLVTKVFIYDFQCEGKKKPAPISENEMKTFMYLSGISTDDILSYFPDELSKLKQFKKFEEVTITTGQFAGQKAIIDREADKLNVLVKFTMVNMYFVVKVPKKDLISAGN